MNDYNMYTLKTTNLTSSISFHTNGVLIHGWQVYPFCDLQGKEIYEFEEFEK